MTPSHSAVLRAHGIRHGYRGRQVLRGVNLELEPGQLVGVVGENGAGKSTLLQILAGDLAPAAGTVEYRGTLGYCPQASVLHEMFSVEQHLRFFQVAYGLDTLDRAHELLEILHCAEYRAQRPRELSGGTRQKLNLVLSLMHDPDILLLDEPTQGFDWRTYRHFWDELAEDLRRRRRSILYVTHFEPDITRLDQLHQLTAGVLSEADHADALTTTNVGAGS